MQRRLRLTDLHFSRHESLTLSAVLQPAREKCFAAAILTPNSFETAPSRGHLFQFVIECGLKLIHPYRESVEFAGRKRAPPERIQDFTSLLRTDHNRVTRFQTVSAKVVCSGKRFRMPPQM